MLSCKISRGVSGADCKTSVAGVLRMAIANWDSTHTFESSSSACTIDTIDLGDEKAYPFDTLDGTANALCTGTIGTGNKYYLHQVNGTLSSFDCEMLQESVYNGFFLGRVIIFVETKNGQVLLFGADAGLSAEQFELQTGAADSDATGIAFSYQGAQRNPPLVIDSWATVKEVMDNA